MLLSISTSAFIDTMRLRPCNGLMREPLKFIALGAKLIRPDKVLWVNKTTIVIGTPMASPRDKI